MSDQYAYAIEILYTEARRLGLIMAGANLPLYEIRQKEILDAIRLLRCTQMATR